MAETGSLTACGLTGSLLVWERAAASFATCGRCSCTVTAGSLALTGCCFTWLSLVTAAGRSLMVGSVLAAEPFGVATCGTGEPDTGFVAGRSWPGAAPFGADPVTFAVVGKTEEIGSSFF